MQVGRPPSGIVSPRWGLELVRHWPRVTAALWHAVLRLPHGRVRRTGQRFAWQSAIEALHQREYEVVCRFVDDNLEVFPLLSGGEGMAFDLDPIYRGPEGFETFLRAWVEPWEEFRLEPQQLIDFGDDRLLSLDRVQARGRGSGVVVTNDEAQLWTFHRGRPVRILHFWNWGEALEAAGLQE